jgi:hypothetical protein
MLIHQVNWLPLLSSVPTKFFITSPAWLRLINSWSEQVSNLSRIWFKSYMFMSFIWHFIFIFLGSS